MIQRRIFGPVGEGNILIVEKKIGEFTQFSRTQTLLGSMWEGSDRADT